MYALEFVICDICDLNFGDFGASLELGAWNLELYP